jgi:hypothetical protein
MVLQVQTIERKVSLTQALPIELISYFIKKKRTKKKKRKKEKKKKCFERDYTYAWFF